MDHWVSMDPTFRTNVLDYVALDIESFGEIRSVLHPIYLHSFEFVDDRI